jgi:hypothetical protein
LKQTLLWTVVLGLTLSATAMAQGQDKGHGKGNPHNQAMGEQHGRGGDRDDDRRWERRDGWEYQTFRGDDRPPGWSKGRKTGWGNCGMPPGQAKKYGCNRYRYQGRDYYWYRNDEGHIIVRRPIISIHGGVDIH